MDDETIFGMATVEGLAGGVAKRVKSGRLKRCGWSSGGALLQTLKTASGNLGYSVVIPIIHVSTKHGLGYRI